jgi:hypothetical protein
MAEASEEGLGSKWAVVPMMMMIGDVSPFMYYYQNSSLYLLTDEKRRFLLYKYENCGNFLFCLQCIVIQLGNVNQQNAHFSN